MPFNNLSLNYIDKEKGLILYQIACKVHVKVFSNKCEKKLIHEKRRHNPFDKETC